MPVVGCFVDLKINWIACVYLKGEMKEKVLFLFVPLHVILDLYFDVEENGHYLK